MSKPDRFDSVAAEAPPSVEATPVTAPKTAKLELLDDDEVVQISIKPSVWFIPIVSFKWLVTATIVAVAIAIAMRHGWTVQGLVAFQVVLGIAALRVGIATLQWASKLYVLTNRRVMRFRGILHVDMAACPLARISRVDLNVDSFQRTIGLGTIEMTSEDDGQRPIDWQHVGHAAEIHDRLVRAVRKSQS